MAIISTAISLKLITTKNAIPCNISVQRLLSFTLRLRQIPFVVDAVVDCKRMRCRQWPRMPSPPLSPGTTMPWLSMRRILSMPNTHLLTLNNIPMSPPL